MIPLAAYRERFPILSQTTYLISNSLGAMPVGAQEGLIRYAEEWKTLGVRAWQQWWELPRIVGDKVARVIGAEPDTVSMHVNVTSTEAIVASCFDFSGRRNKVVYCDMNFPSVSNFYLEQRSIGAEIVIVETDGIGVDTQRLLDAIDDRTILVPISHALFRSAFIQDAKAISAHCEKVGAHLVLDTYQSAGVMPVEVEKWGVHFTVGGTLKWLCGGPGNAFLYVRPDIASGLRPRITGWLADKNPFDFNAMEHPLEDGSYRFNNGTPNIPGLYAAIAGLDIINEIGVARIRENSIRQTAMLLSMAEDRGWKTTTPLNPNQRGGTVAFDFDSAYEIAQELIERKVLVDYRPNSGVRVSPHFYTTDEEILKFFEETSNIIETDAHKKHVGTKTLVT